MLTSVVFIMMFTRATEAQALLVVCDNVSKKCTKAQEPSVPYLV